jgi:putative ABC transport system permease protein
MRNSWKFWRRRRADSDFAEEISSHVQLEADQLQREGMSGADAHSAARRTFGNVTAWKERFHEASRLRAVDALTNDLQYAVRSLRSHPVFTGVAVVSLAIGVSVASGVTAVLQASSGHGTPFRNADRVVAFYRTDAEMETGRFYGLSVGALDRAVRESRTISAIGTWEVSQLTLRSDEWATLAYTAAVSASVPRILGLRTALGRMFIDSDEQAGAVPMALLAFRYWQSRFAGDTGIVGRTITIDGVPHMVLGVLEPRAELPSRVELWTLRSMRATLADTSSRPSAVALLASGATAASATAELSALGVAVSGTGRQPRRARTIGVTPFAEYLSRDAKPTLLILSMIGIVVGLIAATNFAALVLARGIRRRGELAIRAALGASASRLASFMIVECALIAIAGGVLGGVLAPVVVQSLGTGMGGLLPPWMQLSVSLPLIATAIALSLVLGIVFGAAPALELARPAALGTVRGNPLATLRQRSGRKLLVAVQVALATGPIVFVAALFGGLLRFGAPALGFNQSNLYVGTVGSSIRDTAWRTPSARASLIDGVRHAPGVRVVAVSHERFIPGNEVRAISVGAPPITSERGVLWDEVTPQFFAALSPTVIAGRLPTDDELAAGAPVAVVTDRTRHILRREPSTGWNLRLRGDISVTVIGVISDVRRTGYEELAVPVVYTGLARSATVGGWSETLWVRSSPGVGHLVSSINEALRYSSVDVPLTDLKSSIERTDIAARELHALVSIAISIFGVALVLASMGIYGTIAYAAVMRRKEVAVRLALGASKLHVARVVMKEAAGQAAIGLLVGVVGGKLATGMIPDATTPISMPPLDVIVLAAVSFAFVLIAASVIPVRRVWRMDFSRTLRDES